MLRFTILFAILGTILGQAGPAKSVLGEAKQLQCTACQFLGASVAARTGANRGEKMAHCRKYDGCQVEMTDCEIIANIHSEIQRTPENFQNSIGFVSSAVSKCSIDSNTSVISEDNMNPAQCMLCFLVYDVLKYINYNILENPMLGSVKEAIAEACAFLNEDLCQALFQPDTFGAIIRGLQDSLGGFYDLIAVQGFGCVSYTDLFGACPGH